MRAVVKTCSIIYCFTVCSPLFIMYDVIHLLCCLSKIYLTFSLFALFALLNLALKVLFYFCLMLYCTAFCTCYIHPPLHTKHHVDLFFSPLSLSPCSNYKKLFCAGVSETMHEIYWPGVPPFETQDVANRSCAISHLLRLPCKADLSFLEAIFKLWAPETYGATGNFIINALHLSDLIQACRRSCQSMLYIYAPLRRTRALVTKPTSNTLAGVTPGEAFLWTALRTSHDMILFTSSVEKCERNKEKRGCDIILWSRGLTREPNTKGLDILCNLSW